MLYDAPRLSLCHHQKALDETQERNGYKEGIKLIVYV